MTWKAFFVVLPVDDAAGVASPVTPARFELTRQGGWWVLYNEPAPIMVPTGQKIILSAKKAAMRRADSRKYLLLKNLYTQVAQNRALFVVTSEDLGFLRWAYDKANALGYLNWTKPELVADTSAPALQVKSVVSAEDRALIRDILAGQDPLALDALSREAIENTTPTAE